jgi:osmoprotectant transport system ATP-binding protein
MRPMPAGPAETSPAVEFRDAGKTFRPGAPPALAGLTLSLARGETLVLLGTSGSGKTTALRLVNRLIEATTGQVLVEGRPVGDWEPVALRRRTGYVIQDIGLMPHWSVIENVEAVPRLQGVARDARRARAREVLALCGLGEAAFETRRPHELSGGQRQRAGIARALAADPPLLLMDEPFGALDPLLRGTLQEEFRALARRLAKSILFVTHDVHEAFLLADRIGVMDAGRLVRLDAPAGILRDPGAALVERFLGRHRRGLAEIIEERGA